MEKGVTMEKFGKKSRRFKFNSEKNQKIKQLNTNYILLQNNAFCLRKPLAVSLALMLGIIYNEVKLVIWIVKKACKLLVKLENKCISKLEKTF